ncbi:MAG: hypothetical protein P8H17_03055 [Flavobacteriales bacterium]|nr:hypothetical protein [Flavobacteriales bacterium]
MRRPSGEQDYKPHSFHKITGSFKTKIYTTFCTSHQSTKTNLRNYLEILSYQLFLKNKEDGEIIDSIPNYSCNFYNYYLGIY